MEGFTFGAVLSLLVMMLIQPTNNEIKKEIEKSNRKVDSLTAIITKKWN